MTKRWSRFWYNPIIVKECQWRIRRGVTPWIVFFHLFFVGIFIFGVLFVTSIDKKSFGGLIWGTHIVFLLSFIQLIIFSFFLPVITSGLISSEQERQTLPLLLTTTLSSNQIIFGKWFSSISFMLLLYISTLPIYAVIYSFGGISLEQIVCVCLHLFVSMFFVGSVGIFFSTLFKRTVIATTLSYLVVMIWGIGIIVNWILDFFKVLMLSFDLGGYIVNKILSIFFKFQLLYSLHPVVSMFYALGEEEFYSDLLSIQSVNFPVYPIYLIVYAFLTVVLLVCSAHFISLKRT